MIKNYEKKKKIKIFLDFMNFYFFNKEYKYILESDKVKNIHFKVDVFLIIIKKVKAKKRIINFLKREWNTREFS